MDSAVATVSSELDGIFTLRNRQHVPLQTVSPGSLPDGHTR